MNVIYKILAYIFISLVLGGLAYNGESCFFDEFSKNVISLLATLLAINIAANAIFVVELGKLKVKHPEAQLDETTSEMKLVFATQVLLLISLFVILVTKDFLISLEIDNIKPLIIILTNAFVVGVFLYYLEAIYDLGKALLDVVNFNNNS